MKAETVKTDTSIRNKDIMSVLIENLGLIEAEHFVMLVQKEAFDYTKCQENLFENMTIEETYNNVAKTKNKKKIDSEQQAKSNKKTGNRL